MDIKQILLVLSAETASDHTAEIALRLARTHGARVAGLCLHSDPDPPPRGDALERARERLQALTDPARTWFQELVADHGLSDGWEVGALDGWRDVIVHRARLVDLVVADAPAGAAPAYRDVVEALAMGAGSPLLLVPKVAPAASSGHDFDRVVLAWNGTREAKRAMADGLCFLRAANEVAVVVAKEETTRSIGQVETDALVRHLARHGVHAQVLVSEARGRGAGDVLVERCAEFRADLLVMGAFGRPRAAQLQLGGATRTLLARAAIPTLLSH
ncbi:MAG TPA: universal stress protein [Caulobacteraceae bacterium]|nr:universal stress protein [Caulobacteraceae bacterium]